LRIAGLVNPTSVGYNAPAIVGISIAEGDIEQIATEIARYDEINCLMMVSGEFDLVVEVLCKDHDHLANFLNHKLRKIPGVERTQTFMALRTFKRSYGAPPMKKG
jgi:Lrp/AsnC family transcriptional regulator for asnA, asnC and gidA